MSIMQASIETVADLLEQLGDIPPYRIRMHPMPGTATEQDVIHVHDRTGRLYELIDGILVEKTMAFYESCLASVLIQLLRNFLDQHALGVVTAPDGMMRLAPGLVRIPDVAFISWDQFPNRLIPREPIPSVFPDLAVEVLSEGNTATEMARKCQDYFDAGSRLVWLVDPPSRTVEVYTAPGQSTVLNESQSVDGGHALPGFTLSIREWFDRAGKQQGA